MTVYNAWKTTETESQFRRVQSQLFIQGAFLNARNGVLGPSGLGVTTSTSPKSVRVDAGSAVTQQASLSGAWITHSDAALDIDVLTDNPVGGTPRNDIVIIDSGTESIRVLIGQPNAAPEDPTVPATAVALQRIRHAAGATSIPASALEGGDLRTWTVMRGGIVNVRNEADRAGVYPRQSTAIYRADLGRLELHNGTDWDQFYPDRLTKALCPYGTGYEVASTGPEPSVQAVGREVKFQGKVSRTGGTGLIVCTVPTAFRPAADTYDPNVSLAVTAWNSGSVEGPQFNAACDPATGRVTIGLIDTGKPWGSSTFINIIGSWFR